MYSLRHSHSSPSLSCYGSVIDFPFSYGYIDIYLPLYMLLTVHSLTLISVLIVIFFSCLVFFSFVFSPPSFMLNEAGGDAGGGSSEG